MRLFLASLLVSSSAWAGDNMNGGRIVEDTQGYVEAGFPWIDGGVRLPMNDGKFELRPHLKFSYAEGLAVGALGLSPGVAFRVPLKKLGEWDAALTFDVPVTLGFAPGIPGGSGGVALGVGLGHPGFAVTYNAADVVELDLGIRFEDNLSVYPGVTFSGAVPLVIGAEGDVGGIRLGGRIEGGPAFFAYGPYSGVGGTVRALVSIGLP